MEEIPLRHTRNSMVIKATDCTTISSVTRMSSETIGQSLKTMFTRMSQIKIGKLFEDDPTTINQVSQALDSIGVALMEDENTFRPFGDVLDDIASKWDTLNDKQQGAISQTIAGIRQMPQFLTLMTNYDEALRAQAIEANSAGLALNRYSIYLNGVEAAANRLTAAWEGMWQKTIKSSDVKTFYNIAAALLEILTNAGGLIPVVTTLVGLSIAFQRVQIASFLAKTLTGVVDLIVGLKALTLGIKAVQISAIGLTGTIGIIIAAISIISMIASSTQEEIKSTTETIQELDATLSEIETTLNSLKTSQKSIKDLGDEFETLRNKTNKSAEEEERWADLQNRVKTLLPTVAGHYDNLGNFILDTSINLNILNEMMQKNIDLQMAEMQIKAAQSVEEKTKAYQEQIDILDGLNKKIAEGQEARLVGTTVAGGVPMMVTLTEEEIKTAKADAEIVTLTMRKMVDDVAKEFSRLTPEQQLFQESVWNLSGLENFAEAVKEASGKIGDDLPAAVEDASISFDKLNDASEKSSESFISANSVLESIMLDYQKYGQITLEQANNMIEAGYAAALQINQETGAITINTGVLRELVIARAQAAAADAQLAYQAASSIDAHSAETKALWAKWQALASIAKLIQKTKDAVVIPTTYIPAAVSGTKELTKAQEAYNDLLSMTIKMLKQNAEDQKDALDDELDGYKKIIDAQKKLLKLKKEQDDYNKDLADANKELSDIDNELLQIQFDNSEEAKKRRLELESEKAGAIEDIDELQADRSYEIQVDALDAEYDKYKEIIDAKLSELDNYLKNSGELNQEAINLLSSRTDSFYQSLLDWNRKFGTGVDNDVIAKWQQATDAFQNYAGTVGSGLSNIGDVEITTTVKSSRQLFNEGEEESWNAWLKYKELHGYHTGGIVEGIPTSKSGEVYAKLMEGEVVSSDAQMKSFINQTLPSLVANVGGSTGVGDISMIFNVAGNLDKTILPDIKNLVAKTLKDTLNSRGFVPNARLHSI